MSCIARINVFATCSVVKMTYSKVFSLAFLCLVLVTISETLSDLKKFDRNRKLHEDCGECAYYRCPEDSSKCLLGSVADPCECCPAGRCSKLGGEACWNSSIPTLSGKNRKAGVCAKNYFCQLRNDLLDEDEPEAICICMEQSTACGSNGNTYVTPCALYEEAMHTKNSTLKLKHLGPCPSRPWILSPLENVSTMVGQRVALNCETKGFPVPDISWEFLSVDGAKVIKLPNNEHESTVHTSDPENLIRTSWLQIARITSQHSGTYQCIANNTMGKAVALAFVSII